MNASEKKEVSVFRGDRKAAAVGWCDGSAVLGLGDGSAFVGRARKSSFGGRSDEASLIEGVLGGEAVTLPF